MTCTESVEVGELWARCWIPGCIWCLNPSVGMIIMLKQTPADCRFVKLECGNEALQYLKNRGVNTIDVSSQWQTVDRWFSVISTFSLSAFHLATSLQDFLGRWLFKVFQPLENTQGIFFFLKKNSPFEKRLNWIRGLHKQRRWIWNWEAARSSEVPKTHPKFSITHGSFIVTSCLHSVVTFSEDAASDSPVVMEQKEAARVCVMFWTLLCLLLSKNITLLRRHKAWCVYMASRDVGNRAAAHGGEQPVDCEGSQLRRTRSEVP